MDGRTYQAWGWPVAQHSYRVRLNLDREIDLLTALRTAGEFLAIPRTATSMASDHSEPENK